MSLISECYSKKKQPADHKATFFPRLPQTTLQLLLYKPQILSFVLCSVGWFLCRFIPDPQARIKNNWQWAIFLIIQMSWRCYLKNVIYGLFVATWDTRHFSDARKIPPCSHAEDQHYCLAHHGAFLVLPDTNQLHYSTPAASSQLKALCSVSTNTVEQ